MSAYLIHLGILIGIYVILATSLNLAMGFTGLLNLGHIAFFGIGAYTSALLTMAGVPFIVAFFLAGILAALFGFLLVLATRNLKGDYLGLATLGFGFVVYSIFLNWTGLTRGPLGIPGIPKPSLLTWTIQSNTEYLFFVLLVTALTLLLLWILTGAPYGRVLEAVRDDEIAAKVLGKNVSKLKCQAMGISAFFAGIAGSLFAHYITYIDPSSFFLSDMVLLLTIVMIGGLASLRGSVVATVIILLIPEALRFVALPSSMIGSMRQMMYALLLIVILLYRPRGFSGRVDLA